VVQQNAEIGGLRVTFEMTPGNAELIEMRLVLKSGEQTISESWVYRWTKA
jgi:glucans biosynthesis protein